MEGQERKEKALAHKADLYYDRYRPYMDQLEGTVLAKVRGGRINEGDVVALGGQLEQWESYYRMHEEEGNTNLLGQLPNVAMSVITAVQGVSILPIIASVQPIEEEQGIVYFRQVRASDTKGNATAGDVLEDPRQIDKSLSGYASSEITGEVGDTGDGSTTTFTFTLAAAPLKSESLRIRMESGSVEAKDIGAASAASNTGRIWGSGVSGTVNYTTGAVSLTFATAPSNGNDILCDYLQNVEKASDTPQIDSFFATTDVRAKMWVLKGTFGMFQQFAMQKRFGKMVADEMAKDLVAEINKEIGADLIKQLRANAVGSTSFDRTPPSSNISKFENRQEIEQAFATANATLAGNAGRGEINVLISGRTQAATLSTLKGFVKMGEANAIGPHVYGTWNGTTVVVVNEAAVLGAELGVGLWKGPTPWEAPAVYAPYMPLVMTNVQNASANPFQSQRAAGVWAAIKTCVPAFATKFDFITS